MNGRELRTWLQELRIAPEALAGAIGLHVGSVTRLQSLLELDKRTVLALARLGCPQAQQEIERDTGITRVLQASQGR